METAQNAVTDLTCAGEEGLERRRPLTNVTLLDDSYSSYRFTLPQYTASLDSTYSFSRHDLDIGVPGNGYHL